MSKALRHFLDLNQLPTKELRNMLAASMAMKAKLKAHEKPAKPLDGKTLAMIFEKPSTRTRVSFEVGVHELGGHALFLNRNDIQLGRGESVEDTAKVLSRFVHGLIVRTFDHTDVERLAAAGSVGTTLGASCSHSGLSVDTTK